MSTTLVRVQSPAVVTAIAAANRVSYSRTNYAASVTLDSVCYFWVADSTPESASPSVLSSQRNTERSAA